MKMTEQDFKKQLYVKLLLIKHVALAHHGYTPDQMVEVQEYEFDFNRDEKKVNYMEIWADGKRTKKGYKKLKFPITLKRVLGNMTEDYFQMMEDYERDNINKK